MDSSQADADFEVPAPISLLPSEILQQIFLLLSLQSNSTDYYLQIIRITQVCRRWRDIGLNQPELWTNINDDYPHLIQTLLKRSKSAPLTIRLHDWNLTQSTESAILEALSQRTLQSLEIHGSPEFLLARIKCLPHSAPALHTLLLNVWLPTGTRLPDLFPEGAPHLRNLTLRECHLPWTSPLFQGLTSLKLDDRSLSPVPSASQFLDALEKMPGLVKLSLNTPLPDLDTPTTKDRLVTLSRLQFLYLDGTFKEGHDLLQHVVMPASATVSFEMHEEGRLPTNPSLLPRLVPESSSGIATATSNRPQYTQSPPLSLEITHDGGAYSDESMAFYVWQEHIDFSSPSPEGGSYFNVTGSRDALAAISALPCRHVRSLSLQLYPEECLDLEDILYLLVAVEDVFVCEIDAGKLVGCLFRDLPVDYLPSMKMLTFEYAVLSGKSICNGLARRDTPPLSSDNLWEMLRRRRRGGAKLEKLRFNAVYNLTRARVARLEEVVDEVIWDGKGEFYDCRSGLGENCSCRL